MPYTSMPAWPDLSDQEVSDLAYFITTFSPDFSSTENVPKPVPLPSAPSATNESDRAREEALRRDRLRQVPRHARPGRRTFGANAEGRLGLSDTRGEPRAELDLPGRVVPRGHLQDDEHGVQRHADAVVPRRAARPSSDGRSPTTSSRCRGATGPAIPTSSSPSTSRIRSIWPRGPRASPPLRWPAFRSSGRSWSPDARSIRPRPAVTVQAIYDADSIALLVRWHDMSAQKTGKNGPSLPVPPEEEEEAAAAAGGRPAVRRRAPSATRKSRPAPAGQAQRTPLPRRRRQPSAIRVLRRRRDPDSVAGADRRPQALFHLRRRAELGGSLVLRSGPPRAAAVHRQGKRGHRARTTQAISPVSRATTRANGRSSSSGRFAQPRARRSRPESSCRSPSRSGTGSRASVATGEVSRCGTPSTSSPRTFPRPSARW